MCRYPQRIVPDQAQAQLLPREQGVVCVCVRLLGLKVVIRLFEDGTVETLILIRGHCCLLSVLVYIGISQLVSGKEYGIQTLTIVTA